MAIMNGYDVNSRERVWTDDDPIANKEFMLEAKGTLAGKRYFADFACPENDEKVIAAVWQLYPDAEYVTVSAFVDAIATLLAAGELTRVSEPEVPSPAPEPRPVDKNGKPLTDSQIRWSEMTKFASENSMREVNARKRVDRVFADFIRTNLFREFEPVGDSLVEANPHLVSQRSPTSRALADERLVQFADRFRKMSSQDVRAARSLAINPNSAKQFSIDENECYRLGLL